MTTDKTVEPLGPREEVAVHRVARAAIDEGAAAGLSSAEIAERMADAIKSLLRGLRGSGDLPNATQPTSHN